MSTVDVFIWEARTSVRGFNRLCRIGGFGRFDVIHGGFAVITPVGDIPAFGRGRLVGTSGAFQHDHRALASQFAGLTARQIVLFVL